MDTREFFKAVYGEGEGKAVIVLPNFDGRPINDYWFDYPAQLDEMLRVVDENKTGSVWFSPNLFGSESRTKEASLILNVAAADADTCVSDNFRLLPSIVVETSPGRFQVYWQLEGNNESAEVAKLNRRIAQVHKDQGCDTAFVNQAKLMRVPGTSNHKHPGAITFLSEFDADTTFTFDHINELYPETEVPDAETADFSDIPMPDDIGEYIETARTSLLSGIPTSAVMKDLLFGKYHEDRRSEARFKLLCELYRIGLDDKGVMALAWGAPTNKYRDDPRGYSGLWAEAMKAKSYMGEAADGETNASVEIDSEEVRIELAEPSVSYNFLTVEEAEEVSRLANFVDEWCNWASKATDAPVEYHRQAALTILSVVYSEYGHVRPSFARDKVNGLKLNVWFMTLGRSTKDRKSTARQYMITLLHALEDGTREYLFPEDFTPSSVSLLLPEWEKQSVVYARDEVQGLFAELLGQSYMSGGEAVMTKLYDGWSPSRARASGDKKKTKSVPVSFIMSLTGILTETTDILTIKAFKSGFLTRFLYVTAERPPGYVKPPIEQAPSDDEEDEGDLVFDSFVQRFQLNKNYWEMYVADGNTLRIFVEDDAWDRYQKFEEDIETAVQDTFHREVVSSSADRLIISVLKVAALLAMDERSHTVQMSHMLQAIAYAGEWFKNLVLIAGMISESDWERDVTQLEKFILSKGGRCTYAQAYRQFTSKKPQEFDQMVDALVQRGICSRSQSGNSWVLQIKIKD